MKKFAEYVNVKSTWRTIVLLIAIALLANPNAPLPFLGLYVGLILFAVLLPVRSISNMVLIQSLGFVTVGLGGWLSISSVGSALESGAFIVVGLIAIALPIIAERMN